MPFFDLLRARSAYVYLVVGIAWLGVAALAGSLLILWPVVACIAAGALLILRPGKRFTWAWVLATAVLGLLLAAYQVYSWASFVLGAFAAVAGEAIAVFLVLAVIHAFLLFAGASGTKPAKSEQSQKTS
jgi:heme/copper-type cytochrome/quinol oxidase subunit 3